MKEYKYFVSYWFSNVSGKTGFGSIEITLNYEINNYDKVEKIKEYLDSDMVRMQGEKGNCIVLNFILLK